MTPLWPGSVGIDLRQAYDGFRDSGRKMVLVAVGANLAGPGGRSPLDTCRWAAERVGGMPGLTLVACSRWWRSAPVPPSGQPDYVNGVVRLRGAAEPHALLAALHAIEAEAGRVRGAVNAARTLDLDLLAVGGLVVADAGLALPHPRLAERAFVLLPLLDVAADWVHPDGRGVAEMLAGVDRGGVSVLA